MNSLQWLKYQFYNFITFLFPKGMILFFSSSPKTEWFRNTFFRPMGMPEIYKKKIQYFHYSWFYKQKSDNNLFQLKIVLQ